MAECACIPECDTAGDWCRVAPAVFISLKFGQSIGGDKSPFPIPKTQSAFHPLAQRNAFRRRDVRQPRRLKQARLTSGQVLLYVHSVHIKPAAGGSLRVSVAMV